MFELQNPGGPVRKHTLRMPSFIKFLDANPGQWAIFKRYPKEGYMARKRVYEYRQQYGRRGYEFTHETVGDITIVYGRKVAETLAGNTRS